MPREHARTVEPEPPGLRHAPGSDLPLIRPFAPGSAGPGHPASGAGHHFGQVAVEAPPVQRRAEPSASAAGPGSPAGAAKPGRQLEVRDSPIHGKGLFANKPYNPGDPIEVSAAARQGAGGPKQWEMSRNARYTNHRDDPNVRLSSRGGRLIMTAGRAIRPDEEVTVDYDEVGRRIGAGRLSWRGRTVPEGGGESFFRRDRE